MVPPSALSRTIAGVRMATSVFFLLFGEYKVAGPGFAHGGFKLICRTTLRTVWLVSTVRFWRNWFCRTRCFSVYVVGLGELLIGISLLVGLWVRPACVLGILFLLNMLLATWWGPGHGVPVWRYFGAELDHLPLLLLFIIFFTADAGRVWGLDGRRKRG